MVARATTAFPERLALTSLLIHTYPYYDDKSGNGNDENNQNGNGNDYVFISVRSPYSRGSVIKKNHESMPSRFDRTFWKGRRPQHSLQHAPLLLTFCLAATGKHAECRRQLSAQLSNIFICFRDHRFPELLGAIFTLLERPMKGTG